MAALDEICCAFLECGYLDLQILDDVGYSIGEIIDDLREEGINPTLNAITDEIFHKGVEDLKEKIDDRIRDLEYGLESCDDDEREDMVQQQEALLSLDPDEDIEWFCNCLDTSIYYVNNREIYEKYLEADITDIECDMGFDIQ